MAKQTKKQAPTGAQTKTAGKTPAHSEYAGKPAEKGKPYAGKPAEYDSKTLDGLKEALYKVAEASYQVRNREPLSEIQKTSLRSGIAGLVDAAQLLGKADPQLAYGLQAVLVGDAAKRHGIESEEGRHYLSQIAAGLAEKGGLKPYEAPSAKTAGGHAYGVPHAGNPAGAYGGLPPDLGQMIAKYFAGGAPAYGNKS